MTAAGAIAPAAHTTSRVHRVVLPNGLTVLASRDSSAPVVAIVTYVKTGYFDETDDIVGIAHVLEHMFFKGTPERGVGEIARETKGSGGYLNAHTIYDHTSYYTVLPASSFEQGLEIQADAYANSSIAAAELGKELEVIIQEAKRKADDPVAVATETLYELLHDSHRIRRWRIGREPGLRALNQDALVRFYRNFYRPRNTVLSVVGDIDLDVALRHIERLYGALPDARIERVPGPQETAGSGFRYREWEGDVALTQLLFGWRTPETLHIDTPALDLLAAVLGAGRASRLYRGVRERQLASSVSAYNYTPRDLGVFVVHAETEAGKTAEAAGAIWQQLAEICDAGVGDHELERARCVLESRWIRQLETMEGQASHLAEWEALGDWKLADRYLENLLATTGERVREVARQYLQPDRAGVVVYHPRGTPALGANGAAVKAILDRTRVLPLAPSPPRVPAPILAKPPGSPRFETEIEGVRVYRTERGVPVLVRRKDGARVTHMGVFALGGASEEGADHAGLTTLLARTAIKGTERRSATQIAEDSEMLGGGIGSSVNGDGFGWSISVPTKHTEAAVELLADVVQHATIPDGALETERSVALADVAQMRDDMYRYPVRLATEAAFANHAYGRSVLGTEQSLRAIGSGDVRNWHRRRVLEAPVVIAVVGDFHGDDVAASVSRAFPLLQLAESVDHPVPSWPDEVILRAEDRDKAQTALAMAFPGPSRLDDNRYTTQLIANIASGLGGRFFDELRDKRSLAYTVHAFSNARRLAGTFVAYIATSPESEATAREGLLAEFAKLCDRPVDAEELTRAQRYAIGTHAIRQESGGAILGDVVDAWLYGHGLEELGEFEAKVSAVTPARLQQIAGQYFHPERRVEGLIRGKAR
jgi:zinc protease